MGQSKSACLIQVLAFYCILMYIHLPVLGTEYMLA